MSSWRRPQRAVNFTVAGRLEVGGGQLVVPPESVWYVAKDGSNSNDGRSWDFAYLTGTKALSVALTGQTVMFGPGEYDEALTISRAQSKLTLIGAGGRGSVFIAPSAANSRALTNLADDVTIDNVGCDGDGTGGGLLNYGRRFRAYRSKFEGGADAIKLTLGTVAQIAALTHGKGDDTLFEDCEIAWATNGVLLTASDYGALTQAFFKKCYFHGLPTSSFEESGGSASVRYRGLLIDECVFGAGNEETDALPTKWISLNDDNANSGIVSRCVFPDILAGGRNLVSTGLRWIGNYHVAGVAGAQPS